MEIHVESLQGTRAAIFAAACAERLFPMCEQFARETSWSGLNTLAAVLDTVWRIAENSSKAAELAGMEVAELVPHADDYDSCYITAAQNCCVCVDLAVTSLMNSSQHNASVASEYTVDAIASVELCNQEGILSAGDDERLRSMEENIRHGAAVRTELACQMRDANLIHSNDEPAATVVRSVRDSSRRRS